MSTLKTQRVCSCSLIYRRRVIPCIRTLRTRPSGTLLKKSFRTWLPFWIRTGWSARLLTPSLYTPRKRYNMLTLNTCCRTWEPMPLTVKWRCVTLENRSVSFYLRSAITRSLINTHTLRSASTLLVRTYPRSSRRHSITKWSDSWEHQWMRSSADHETYTRLTSCKWYPHYSPITLIIRWCRRV